MRFAAAAMVLVAHVYMLIWYADQQFAAEAVRGTAQRVAFTGVVFFFMLSGFVLAWSARADDTVWGFWRRRIVKIYPNHLVTAAAAVVLLVVAGQQLTAGQIVPNLLLVQSWIPDQGVYSGVNAVSWSLSVELFLYLSFPLLYRLVRRIPPRLLWPCALAAVAAVVALPLVVYAVVPGEPEWAGLGVSLLQYWVVYTLPASRLLEFVLGMLLARVVMEGRWNPGRYWIGLVLFPIGYVVALEVPFLVGISATMVVPLALLVLAAARADVTGSPSLLRRPSMVWLGEVSFALYMVHWLVVLNLYPVLDPGRTAGTAVKLAYSVMFLPLSLLVAAALYTCVERPLVRRWGGRSVRSRPSSRAAPADARS